MGLMGYNRNEKFKPKKSGGTGDKKSDKTELAWRVRGYQDCWPWEGSPNTPQNHTREDQNWKSNAKCPQAERERNSEEPLKNLAKRTKDRVGPRVSGKEK